MNLVNEHSKNVRAVSFVSSPFSVDAFSMTSPMSITKNSETLVLDLINGKETETEPKEFQTRNKRSRTQQGCHGRLVASRRSSTSGMGEGASR